MQQNLNSVVEPLTVIWDCNEDLKSLGGARVCWITEKSTMIVDLRFLPSTILFISFCGSVLPFDQRNDAMTEEVISALDRVLDFYERDYKSINLDGIFGLRVAQGALLSIIKDVQDGQLTVEDNVLNRAKELYNKASQIAGLALPYLQRTAPEYFEKFRKQVVDPWLNFKPFTNKKLMKKEYNPEIRRTAINFDESTSDQCMSGLTGTGSDGNQPCQISDKCWELISADGTEGYALTHQALFFQLGEVQGCTPVLLKRLEQSNIKGGLEGIYNRICSNMYPEMLANEQKRTLEKNNYHRDLFMEQAMVCGSMGYSDFLSAEWLKKILSWQRQDGCFGQMKRDPDEDETEQFSEGKLNKQANRQSNSEGYTDMNDGSEESKISPFGNFKKSLEYEYSQLRRKPLSIRTMRSLLVEKELRDGCFSHLTGVAVGLLGVYLRWVLYSQQKPVHNDILLETKKSYENSVQSKNREVYINDNLVDVIALKGKQLQKPQKDHLQSAHLMQRRKAAMLHKNELRLVQNMDEKGGTSFLSWRMLAFASVMFIVAVILVKRLKKMPNMLKIFSPIRKKSAHVI